MARVFFCLRRQARGRFLELVGVSDSFSSSHHVDHVLTRSVGCAHGLDVGNSCGDMHDARANSWGTLHSACNNSGAHANSYSCAYTVSSGGVRG